VAGETGSDTVDPLE